MSEANNPDEVGEYNLRTGRQELYGSPLEFFGVYTRDSTMFR